MTRIAVVFRLIYCVNDFLTDFMRKQKSSDRLVGSLNKTLVARTRNLGASGDRAPAAALCVQK